MDRGRARWGTSAERPGTAQSGADRPDTAQTVSSARSGLQTATAAAAKLRQYAPDLTPHGVAQAVESAACDAQETVDFNLAGFERLGRIKDEMDTATALCELFERAAAAANKEPPPPPRPTPPTRAAAARRRAAEARGSGAPAPP